jgi:hypothetical protein
MNKRDTEAASTDSAEVNLHDVTPQRPQTALDLALRRLKTRQGESARHGFSSAI